MSGLSLVKVNFGRGPTSPPQLAGLRDLGETFEEWYRRCDDQEGNRDVPEVQCNSRIQRHQEADQQRIRGRSELALAPLYRRMMWLFLGLGLLLLLAAAIAEILLLVQ